MANTITVQIPASAIVAVAPRPATVSQRTVELHFGIPKATYLDMARRGVFPTTRVGRLRIARYEDVEAAVVPGGASERAEAADARALLDTRTRRTR